MSLILIGIVTALVPSALAVLWLVWRSGAPDSSKPRVHPTSPLGGHGPSTTPKISSRQRSAERRLQ